MASLNWLETAGDAFIRPGSVELEGLIHRRMLANFSDADSAARFLTSDRTFWRQQAVIKSQLASAKILSGTVLEIGAGTGWCSSLLSLLPDVKKIYCLDYDPIAVELLMPQVQLALGARTEKIERILGSFNRILLSEEVDFIFAIGALHHSENLHATLAECFKALKPGGWLVALEPTFADSETNAKLKLHYENSDPNAARVYGKSFRFKDNSNHYYRLCEYLAAGYAAKFDVWPFLFDPLGDRNAGDGMLSNRRCWSSFQIRPLYPYFAKDPDNPVFDNLMLMLRRPFDGGCDLGHILSASAPDFERQKILEAVP